MGGPIKKRPKKIVKNSKKRAITDNCMVEGLASFDPQKFFVGSEESRFNAISSFLRELQQTVNAKLQGYSFKDVVSVTVHLVLTSKNKQIQLDLLNILKQYQRHNEFVTILAQSKDEDVKNFAAEFLCSSLGLEYTEDKLANLVSAALLAQHSYLSVNKPKIQIFGESLN